MCPVRDCDGERVDMSLLLFGFLLSFTAMEWAGRDTSFEECRHRRIEREIKEIVAERYRRRIETETESLLQELTEKVQKQQQALLEATQQVFVLPKKRRRLQPPLDLHLLRVVVVVVRVLPVLGDLLVGVVEHGTHQPRADGAELLQFTDPRTITESTLRQGFVPLEDGGA